MAYTPPVTVDFTLPYAGYVPPTPADFDFFGAIILLGSASETGTAPAITAAKTVAIGAAAESGESVDISAGSGVSIGAVVETDTVPAIIGAHITPLGSANESGTAPAIVQQGSEIIALSPVNETGTVAALTAVKESTLSAVSDGGVAHGIAAVKTVTLGVVTESGDIVPFSAGKGVALSPVSESGVAPTIKANPVIAYLSASSPLGAARIVAFHDWSAAIPDNATINYVCRITGTPELTAPMTSWQATLQTGRSNYVQAVLPGVASIATEIGERRQAGEEFVIYRVATLKTGGSIEQEMARAPIGGSRFDRGPTNYTCTITGYSEGFISDDEQPSTRTLTHPRSVNVSGEQSRVRCAIDWFLRPGQTATVAGETLTVAYINYYVTVRDSYMDVGERAA